jgi:hypothetical protein
MTIMFCPGCAAILEKEPRVINGESVMFWVCPEGDWEESVDKAAFVVAESKAEEP